MRNIIFPFYLPDRQTPLPGGIPVPDVVVGRFLSRLRRLPPNRTLRDCWRIDGRSDLLGAYVLFSFKDNDGRGVAIRAHRLSFLFYNGPIYDGFHILHRCNCKGCVNPDHLYAGTQTENVRDLMAWERAEAEAGRVTRRAAHVAKLRDLAARRRALRCEEVAA